MMMILSITPPQQSIINNNFSLLRSAVRNALGACLSYAWRVIPCSAAQDRSRLYFCSPVPWLHLLAERSDYLSEVVKHPADDQVWLICAVQQNSGKKTKRSARHGYKKVIQGPRVFEVFAAILVDCNTKCNFCDMRVFTPQCSIFVVYDTFDGIPCTYNGNSSREVRDGRWARSFRVGW